MIKNNRPIGYQMSQRMFNTILSTRKGEDKKKNPYQYAMEYLNEQAGLKGTVKHISVARD